ncbi:peptidase M23 (plasmid) [Vibrio breoganii]|uniref:Peptidase M23 n=1 Tax=Vibrio breoganii TaxID=553239 RepID=A0AAN0XZM5_9VIBR|nr:peptidoglycan DD-metalloendopeptidase family protein [Vibrio breoganii]ANO35580.1 peptidase M23 [Vibrio breoganii]
MIAGGVCAPYVVSGDKEARMTRSYDLSADMFRQVPSQEPPPAYRYTIQPGDNLTKIFNQLNIPSTYLTKVMEEDVNHLSLDTLRPGNELIFFVDDGSRQLNKMELVFSVANKVQYTLNDDGAYSYEDVSIEGEWSLDVKVGEIHGSFFKSATEKGLSGRNVETISGLLRDKLNFSKDLRAGDTFSVVRKVQTIDGVPTGASEVQSVVIASRGRTIDAYLHSDGQFYDGSGASLERAFMRRPLEVKSRISSRFNPRRRHPVTRRISPHNGVDFAIPTGTPVLAAADGKVIMVRNHPYAGKYLVIEHGSIYKTRYLHMSRIQVKRGQMVKRGQRIGLSGATGRVTGPHLHYELLIRNRAVDPMTANIPMAKSVPDSEMAEFVYNRERLDAEVKDYRVQIAESGTIKPDAV